MISTFLLSKYRIMLLMACICLLASSPMALGQANDQPPSLFLFPRFVASQGVDSGLAIFNPSPVDASVTLLLVSEDGGLVDSTTLTVPALGQTAKTAHELFSDTTLGSALFVASNTPGLIAYYQTFDPAMTYIDGADAPEEAMQLVFPVVPGPEEGIAELSFLNANPRPTAVELKLWGFSGSLLGKATVQVPAWGSYHSLANSIFPSQTNFSGASHITATSKPLNIFSQAQPVSGTSLFAGFSSAGAWGSYVDLAALNALPLTRTSITGVLPYYRVGGTYASTFSLAAVEATDVDVTVTAIADDGSIVGSRRLSIKANGGIRTPVQNMFPALSSGEHQGWLLIRATGRITSAVLYGRSDGASLSATAMQEFPEVSFAFPQIVQGSGSSTEITLVNPASNPSFVDLFVVRPNGATAATTQVVIPPGSRISLPLNQWMPEIEEQSGGYAYVRATEALFALASTWSEDGSTNTSFAPQALTTFFSPAPLKSFAVTGKVTLNGHPAPGFQIVLSGPEDRITTSGDDGSYGFGDLPPGKYSISVDQFGFQFLPEQANFEITTSSHRQDFQGFTSPNAIIVQPGSVPVGSGDTTVAIFGSGFNTSSKAYAGLVQLPSTLVNASQLEAVIPAYLLASPSSLEITVITNDLEPNRLVSESYSFIAYVDRPTLASLVTPGDIVEGTQGATITIIGSGFVKGAKVKVNGVSDDIRVTIVSERQIEAYLPSRYFEHGGIYPLTVVNPYPANIESNIQLLTVFYPPPAVQEIGPASVAARLEPGAGPLHLDVFGYGFRYGAVVLFRGKPIPTSYCEHEPYCLSVHLFAEVPAEYLKQSGFADIVVQNPNPSLGSSETVFMRIDGLQPTITSVVPGSATTLDSPFKYSMPVVVYGTNFGPQTAVRIYREGDFDPPEFSTTKVQVVSSTQLYVTIDVEYLDALGEWQVEVANPPPGGGQSDPFSFEIYSGDFVENPFLISLTPDIVAKGGPSFTLTINGTNFKSGTQVRFQTTPLVTTVISDKQIKAEVPASLIQSAGRVPISVTNPDIGGTSNRLYLDIR